MRNGHLIDLQELRLRELLEYERRAMEQRNRAERMVIEHEARSRAINDAVCLATAVLGSCSAMLFAAMFRADLEKE